MGDVAKRLAGPVLLSSGGATLYTVPASTLTIVRNIHVSNVQNAAVNNFTLGIGTGGSIPAGGNLFNSFIIGPASMLSWSTFLILNTGDQLIGISGASNVLNITISGVEVS